MPVTRRRALGACAAGADVSGIKTGSVWPAALADVLDAVATAFAALAAVALERPAELARELPDVLTVLGFAAAVAALRLRVVLGVADGMVVGLRNKN
jgi:hypothetical protein